MSVDHSGRTLRRVVQLDQTTTAVRTARRAALAVAAEAGVTDRLDDFAVVVSELVTNAVEHGEAPLVMEVVANGGLFVRVSDAGGDAPEVLPPSVSRLRGRGLAIVSRLSDAWGVERRLVGKVVWAELR